MMVRYRHAIAVSIILLIPLLGGAVDATTTFLETHYYLFPLGPAACGPDAVAQVARVQSYSMILYDNGSVEAFRGDSPVDAPADLLDDRHLLIVDRDRFLLRSAGDGFTFTVRPAESGYELVIDTERALPIQAVLDSVLVSLTSFGLLGDELNLDMQAYAKDNLKGPQPPSGVPIESTLYGLKVSRDWHDYAARVGLTLVALRVEVVAELEPGASLDTRFAAWIIESGAGLEKLALPIEQLVVLARSAGVSYIRAPYRPSVP